MPNTPQSLINYLRDVIGTWKDDPRSDAELMALFTASRDEVAFKVLVRRHGEMVWRTCRRILGNTPDAEDVFQSTFLTLTRKAGLFPVKSLAGWLHRVTRQAALNIDAKVRRRQGLEKQLRTALQTETKEDASRNEWSGILDEEIANLPEKLRVPLVLHFLEEKTQDEVARILGCSQMSVRRRLARGESILRKRLEQRGVVLGVGTIAGLLGNTASAPAVPAGLIASTARAAVAFRAGTLSGVTADAAQKLLRALAVEGTARVGWWLMLTSVAFIGLCGSGLVAWKMFGVGSDALMPATPGSATPKIAAERRAERVDLYGDPLPDGALARIGTIRFRPGYSGPDNAGCVVFLPDSKTIISAYHSNFVHFWETATGKELGRLEAPVGIHSLVVSADGKKLAAITDMEVWFWDLGVDPPRKLFCHRQAVPDQSQSQHLSAAAFTLDSMTLAVAVGGLRGAILKFDVSTGKLQKIPNDGTVWENMNHRPVDKRPFHMVFSPDCKTLIAGDTLWDVETGKKRNVLKPKCGDLGWCRPVFSPDNKKLATLEVEFLPKKRVAPSGVFGGKRAVIKIWDSTTGNMIREIATEWWVANDISDALAFLPDSRTLLEFSGSENYMRSQSPLSQCRFLDVESGKIKLPDVICSNPVDENACPMCLSIDGKLLTQVGSAGVIGVWEVATGQIVGPEWGIPNTINALAFTPDGKQLATLWRLYGAPNSKLQLWEADTGRLEKKKEVGRLSLSAFDPDVALSANERSILKVTELNGTDSEVAVYSAITGKQLMSTVVRRQDRETNATLSPDGRRVAAASGEKPAIHLWEVASGTEGETIQTSGAIRSFAWSSDGHLLAGGNEKGDLCLWDLASGREVRHFTGHRGRVTALAFSADGRRLASGSSDTTALVWDLRKLQHQKAKEMRLPSANTLWVALRKKEAAEAWQAMHLLAQNPDVALPLLREHLQPASAPEKEIAYLLAQLDDDNFQVRSRAEVQLEKMGEVIEPALQDALAKKPNPEVLNCIKRLLAKIAESALQSGLYPSQLQAFRGVEVLERIGTPAARQVLEELSRLPARYVQAAESTAALQRLAKLPPASMP